MKIYKTIIFLFCFLLSAVYADEIYLKDNSVIKGKIIQITGDTVEFDPEGDKPFSKYKMGEIRKIIYDDGVVFNISDGIRKDELHMTNGSIIKCTIEKMTDDKVYYYIEDSTINSLPREQIVKIVFGDDEKQLLYDKGQSVPETVSGTSYYETNGSIRDTGYINSFIHICFSFGGGGIYDGPEEETDINGTYFNDADGKDISYSSIGIGADLFLKSVKFQRKIGFDFMGIKLGIKSKYCNKIIDESYDYFDNYEEDDYEYHSRQTFDGVLLDYDSAEIGPEIDFVFSPRNNAFDVVLNMYLLYGYVFDGKINAAPAYREEMGDQGVYYNRSQYHSDLDSGHSVIFGIGGCFALNRILPVTLGMNIEFSYTSLNFDREIPFYGNADGTSFKSTGAELSIGFHI